MELHSFATTTKKITFLDVTYLLLFTTYASLSRTTFCAFQNHNKVKSKSTLPNNS